MSPKPRLAKCAFKNASDSAAVMSGTSMACPLTAGIAALVKQAHPTWHGDQIKAAIMNTADPAKNIGYSVRIAGTGVVQAQHAVKSSVLATTSDSLDSLAFGSVLGAGAYNATKSFTLTNYGATSATYNLSVAGNASQRGAIVTVSPASVTVGAGSTSTVDVMLSTSLSHCSSGKEHHREQTTHTRLRMA